ncbi:MAG: TIGR03790 family protein [Fibrobacterota bacterium]
MARFTLFSIILASIFLSASLSANENPSRVLVVYRVNHTDTDSNGVSDSRDLALYYQAKRGIPESNMLGLTTSRYPAYDTKAHVQLFFEEIVLPLRRKIDSLGRDSIDYIVLCKGMPWRVYGQYPVDENLAPLYSIGSDTLAMNFGYKTNPFFEPSPSVASDRGPFDHSYKINGTDPFYLVTELDGFNLQYAKELVDRALYAEKYLSTEPGYYSGIGYVDTRYGQYTDDTLNQHYPTGYAGYAGADFDMAMGRLFMTRAGFPCKWENTLLDDAPPDRHGYVIGDTEALFSDGSSAQYAPNALWYGGWYNFGQYALNAWSWIPGAVVCDLNSNSMENLQSYTSCFGAGALYQGVTAACGVIGEPGLGGHTHPEKLLYYILNGYNFAEAAYHAEPTLGWKTRNIGDPLYNPMKAKTPVRDTVAPPMPTIITWPSVANRTREKIRVGINTDDREPDLVLCKLQFGFTSRYDSTMDYGTWMSGRQIKIYKMVHEIEVRNLLPDTVYHFKVTLMDPVGNTTETGDLTFNTYAMGVEVYRPKALPGAVCLDNPLPNPFNPSTHISFSLPKAMKAVLRVYNAHGERVATLVSGTLMAGRHRLHFNAEGLSSGVYLCRLQTEGRTLTRRMVLVR